MCAACPYCRLQLPTSDHFLYLYAQMLPAIHPLVVCTALFFTVRGCSSFQLRCCLSCEAKGSGLYFGCIQAPSLHIAPLLYHKCSLLDMALSMTSLMHQSFMLHALCVQELALLDYSMLAFSPSCVAAVALTLSMLCHGQRVECSHMLTELSGSRPSQMRRCAQELLRLHAAAAWPVSAEAKALLQPVCLKFGSRQWYRAAHTPPLPALPYELFRE